MLKRIGIIVVWVAATVGTAAITLAAVSSAGRQVADRPAVPVAGADLAARFAANTTTSTTAVASSSTTTTTAAATTTTASGVTTTTTSGPGATTTTAGTTTTVAKSQNLTFEQPGVGRVTISVEGSAVGYVSSVVLGSGYRAEVDDAGPEKVAVKFENEHREYVFTARVVDGTLQAGFSTDGGED
ncbi:MAG: hypothetical protein A2135_03320 [Actinobacteria bacterium RBG_16_67_15]|nr:MAG: hypothetical protein A2135_03320 [Actinobacteria bacterium RBG_16_67_15]